MRHFTSLIVRLGFIAFAISLGACSTPGGGSTDVADASAVDVVQTVDAALDAALSDSAQTDTARSDAPQHDAAADTGPSDAGDSASGCAHDTDCAGNPNGSHCDPSTGQCVACLSNPDTCATNQYCSPASHVCVAGCHDDAACASSFAHASGRCVAGTCTLGACATGFGNCDDDPTNGCESDFATDANHCGTCATACTGGPQATAVCNAGTCGFVCLAGYADCDGNSATGCESSLSSQSNCGSCTVHCPASAPLCSTAGSTPTCTSGCTSAQTLCGGSCVDLTSDASNCGSCGNVCHAGTNAIATCSGGICSYACASGFADCDSNASDGCEASLHSVSNCGSCGSVCSVTNGVGTCSTGSCAIASCAVGYADCDGQVSTGCETNTQTSTSSCGACANVCSPTANAMPACASGSCSAICQSGFADCDGSIANGCETNVTSDVNNCGACHDACALPNAVSSCASGRCALTMCDPGFADCNRNAQDGCEVALGSDVFNCGQCGAICEPMGDTPVCVSGTCAIGMCDQGFGDCNQMASDGCEATLNSLWNCGACGSVCALPNAGPNCTPMGTCEVAGCYGGFGDCNGIASDGCEANLSTDPNNCLSCGNVCATAPNATPACTPSGCGNACNAGWGDCDTSRTNGCETSLTNDPNNCGGCGVVCAGAPICTNGICDPAPPQLISPLSTSVSPSQTPTFRWSLAPMTDGALVQVCSDRACTNVVSTIAVTGSSGAPATALGAGVFYWRAFGRTGTVVGSRPSVTWELFVSAVSHSGSAYGTVFDENGDGRDDLAAYGSNLTSVVFYNGPTGSQSFRVPAGAGSGFVVNVGDVNGDGFADAVATSVGAPMLAFLGGATVTQSSYLGPAVTWASGGADLDGDGYGDIVVLSSGQLTVIPGGAANFGRAVFGAVVNASMVAVVGDTNGDGQVEIVTCGASGSAQWWATVAGPPTALSASGSNCVAVGDVTGDGRPDFVVSQQGQAVVFGSAMGGTPMAQSIIALTTQGSSATGMFDADRDGVMDLAFGGSATSNTSVMIYRGVSFAPLGQISGTQAGFGASVQGLWDVNGDGMGDVAVGIPSTSTVNLYTSPAWFLLSNVTSPSSIGTSIAFVRPPHSSSRPDHDSIARSAPPAAPSPS